MCPAADQREAALPWVAGLTLPQVLRETARLHDAHDALVFPGLDLRISYGQFAAEVDLAARGLFGIGIQAGEHVAIWATNVPEWVVLQFATARMGAVLVNINPAYRPFELKYVLQQSDAVALVLVGRFKTSDYFADAGRGLSRAGRRPAGPIASTFPPFTLGRGA